MARNKNATIRYQVLDKCFRNTGKFFFIEDLVEACNQALYEFNGEGSEVKKRQIYDDVQFMQSASGWSVPLEKGRVGKKVYYRYEDTNFSINNLPINDNEINQIKSALLVLSRFKGLPQFEWIHEILLRIQNEIETQRKVENIIGFDENRYLKGLHYIGELFNSIYYEKVLKLTYQDFNSDEPYDLLMHPYYLKQYNNRWFLTGYSPENKSDTWMLALDRIKAINYSNKKYKKSSIDWEDYFEDIIGVTKHASKKVQKVKLWIAPISAPYILTKPFHGSQKTISYDDEGLVIQIQVIPNFEFNQRIFSFGDKIKVLSPINIKREIASIITKMNNLYQEN